MARIFRIRFVILSLIVSWAKAQEYIENLHDSKYGTHFKDIPKAFNLKGTDANAQFQKYFNQIQEAARQENLTVLYKITLEIQNPSKYNQKNSKRGIIKKGRSKKYNVPLKKTSMKLSNFELWLRKMAEQSSNNKKGHAQNFEMFAPVTTEGRKVIITTKQIQLKHKPIISRVKTNYTKFVKPVRNRIITLTK